MANSLDLNLMPLVRVAGQDLAGQIGLFAADPPARPARGRSSDRLVLYMAMEGNAPLSPGKQEQLLANLAKTYFETPGSVTSALHAAAEAGNQFLFERNNRLASMQRQGYGLLSMLVLRTVSNGPDLAAQLYLAQSGPSHVFLITASETRHIYDPQAAGRGLGAGRVPTLYYFQTMLAPNDTLLLSVQPSANWTPALLSETHGQGPESLRRRLLNQADIEFEGVIFQVKPGSGKMNMFQSKQAPAVKPPVEDLDGSLDIGLEKQATSAVPVELGAPPAGQPAGEPAAAAPPGTAPSAPGGESPAQAGAGAPARPRSRSTANLDPLLSFAAALFGGLGRFMAWLGRGLHTLLDHILPQDTLEHIPAPTLALVAVLVPLLVVGTSSYMYLSRGNEIQYELFFYQAQDASADAATQTETLSQRVAWEKTLDYLDQAEVYKRTAESQALRTQAQKNIDNLDLIKRLDYKPAIIGGLPDNMIITRLVPAENELYLFEQAGGKALRALLTGSGYEMDSSFECGPGEYDGISVGPLIDIAAWPQGSKPDGAIVGMDAAGTLLFCRAGNPPQAQSLAQPTGPSVNWGDLRGFTLYQNDLYVLDPASNAVWIYWQGSIDQEPEYYFYQEVPKLDDVVQIAVNNDELYLLHADGMLGICFYSAYDEVAPTHCVEPVSYVDLRPGRENTPMAFASPLGQILFSPPPDPSLYFLQPKTRSIYHFSLRNLAFQHQYNPAQPLPAGPATAFGVDQINRVFFLAIGNNIYYAGIP